MSDYTAMTGIPNGHNAFTTVALRGKPRQIEKPVAAVSPEILARRARKNATYQRNALRLKTDSAFNTHIATAEESRRTSAIAGR